MPRGRSRLRNPKKVEEVVNQFAADVVQAVEESQPVERVPGETISGNKVPWTRRDLRQFKQVTLTPSENAIDFQWNGVRFDFVQDQEITVPEPVATAYNQWLQKARGRFRRGLTETGLNARPIAVGGLDPETYEEVPAGA